jgi:hypothetical protein
MRKLSIFDDDVRVATITTIGSSIFIFLIDQVDPGVNLLERAATIAHSYNFSTELIDE